LDTRGAVHRLSQVTNDHRMSREKFKVSPVSISYPKLSDDTVVEAVTDNELSNEYDCSTKARTDAHHTVPRSYLTIVTQQALSYCHQKILSTLARGNLA
jgi:hypothetical protein